MQKLFSNPKLFSYVVARDYGFAPNPFYGYCTLATCKPEIRKSASAGDWIVGTGSKKRGLERHAIYAMHVSEIISFNEYWHDPRFHRKRPNMHASIRSAFGDNIYHQSDAGEWIQADSHHSLSDGTPNLANIRRDTSADRVLIGHEFVYWAGNGPEIPLFRGYDICKKGQGHKSQFPGEVVDEFIDWVRSRQMTGYLSDPSDWGYPVMARREHERKRSQLARSF